MGFGARSPVTATITYLALIFLFAPLVVVVLFSFHSVPSLSLPFQGFSIRWYQDVFASAEFRAATANSLLISTVVSVASALLGTAAAYGLRGLSRKAQKPAEALFLMPLTLPGLFLGLSLLVFYGSIGTPLSLVTVIIGHFIFAFPYFFLVVRAALERLDPTHEEIAADLGATPVQVFFKVTLPQIVPVLAGATCLVFALSFDEFVITFFVIGPQSTLPMYIWSGIRRTIDPSVNTVSSILLVSTLVLFAIAFFMTRGSRVKQEAN